VYIKGYVRWNGRVYAYQASYSCDYVANLKSSRLFPTSVVVFR
jgi:hypothetical protein